MEEVVVIAIGWEAFVALALAAVVVLVVVLMVDLFRWLWRRSPPPPPKIKVCKLVSPGNIIGEVHEWVYECAIDGVTVGQYTWELSALARAAGKGLLECPKILHIPV